MCSFEYFSNHHCDDVDNTCEITSNKTANCGGTTLGFALHAVIHHLCNILVKNPWVHGLNKSRVPSHNGGHHLPCRHLAINLP